MEHKDCQAVIHDAVLEKPRLKITYPRVSGLPDRAVQQRINQAILDQVYALIREQGYIQDPTKEMTGGYEIKWNEGCVLSLYFTNYAYAQGAAHGLTIAHALNIDLRSGRVYALSDLFRKGSGYRARISDQIKKQIKERDVPLIADFKSVDPNEDYFLTGKDLVIFFQAYEYTPYAYGLPEFPIPYGELEDMLGEDSLLRQLI